MKFFIFTLLLIKVLNFELKKTNLKDKNLINISFKKKNSIHNTYNEHYSQNKNSLNLNLDFNSLGNFTNFQISLKRMKVTSIQSKEVLEIFIVFSYFILLTSMKIRLYKITNGKTFTIYFSYLLVNVTQI
jgi:hypothetical protein